MQIFGVSKLRRGAIAAIVVWVLVIRGLTARLKLFFYSPAFCICPTYFPHFWQNQIGLIAAEHTVVPNL